MIGYSRFHTCCHAEALVDANKIVVHHVDYDSGAMILNFLREAIRETLPGARGPIAGRYQRDPTGPAWHWPISRKLTNRQMPY